MGSGDTLFLYKNCKIKYNFCFVKKFPACKVVVYTVTVVTLNLKGGKGAVPILGQLWDNFTHMHIRSFWWRHETLVIAN